MKPSTTFTLFIQFPLLSLVSREGKRARIVNGRANETEKASIVTIGVQNSPCVDLISTEPTIGPVQEKETSTRVKAMKKMPASPSRSEFRSLLFTIQAGSSISKAPKKDIANTMNTRKKITFGSQCVASQLKMSAVIASPPTSQVTAIIKEIGTV